MLHTASLIPFRRMAGLAALATAILMAGCAQQRPDSYYDAPLESTLTDARKQAQGRRGARAPSQLQIGFGENERKSHPDATPDAGETATAAGPRARPLAQPRTFLGTMPCLTDDADCPASRVTLTFAPGGEWRARTVLLDAPGADRPIVQQGCWNVTGSDPLRIVLETRDGASKAAFVFVNDNVLRVTRFNDRQPTLDYHLTRQADIDPIAELDAEPLTSCD